MSVHAKLLEAQKSVEAVVKQGNNSAQGYKYAMASDVIGVCRKALHEAGLVGAVTRITTQRVEPYLTDKQKRGVYAEVGVMLSVFDVDKEDSHVLFFEGVGAGSDFGGGDKAILKAQTGATKYAYANALALPFADHDPEKDVPGEAGRVPVAKPEPSDLPDEKVDALVAEIKEAGVGFDQLCLILGAHGANAPKIKRKDSVRKSLASLTETQYEGVFASVEGQKGNGLDG